MQINRFAKYAWFVMGYNILVVLWGAFVRATGSGAGCGSHWPLCNGEIIPLAPTVARVIEFTHRTMSGAALLLVLGLVVWAFRAYPRGNPVRAGAVASGIFILTEALIGAGLVLFGWVAQDQSTARVISISLHLINTFLLLASLTLTAWWASGGTSRVYSTRVQSTRVESTRFAWRSLGRAAPLLILALLGVTLIGITGAVTALGDTLFPAGSLAEGLQQDLSPTASVLLRLRVIHPVVAVAVGIYVLLLTFFVTSGEDRQTSALANVLRALFALQLTAGALNIVLLAPTWMQLVHLLLADLVWLALVLFAASLLESARETFSFDARLEQMSGIMRRP